MNKKIVFVLIITSLIAISAVSAQNSLLKQNNDDSMYQVSIMQAFMHGEYDGVITVGDFKKHGDIGLGTFEGVNGEMIVLDGVVYQAAADGSIKVMQDNETVPFATITNFDEDANINNVSANNFNDLTVQLNKTIKKFGVNNMYVVKLKGDFSNITVRSVEKQQKPYKEFTDVAKVDQKVFNHSSQSGTLVAVYFPDYMNELNMPGWHLHFLSDDKSKGGHVLGFNNFKGSAQIDEIHEFNMILPSDNTFPNMNFTEDMSAKISSVE